MALVLCMGNTIHFLQKCFNRMQRSSETSPPSVCSPSLSSVPLFLPPFFHLLLAHSKLSKSSSSRPIAAQLQKSSCAGNTSEQRAKWVRGLDKCPRYLYKYTVFLKDLYL